MREYESWSFADKSFAWALLISLLWHFFWFFSVSIVVSPQKRFTKQAPRIVSLGPVLDDTIFRTLIETRTPLSQTFYRRLSDFEEAVEVEVQKVERHASGDVVSVPMGQHFLESARELVGGEKFSPGDELSDRIGLSDEEKKRREEEERHKRMLDRA